MPWSPGAQAVWAGAGACRRGWHRATPQRGAAGYDGGGILTSPEGRHDAVAVPIGRTSRRLPERMTLMRRVAQAPIDHDARLATPGAAADLRRAAGAATP